MSIRDDLMTKTRVHVKAHTRSMPKKKKTKTSDTRVFNAYLCKKCHKPHKKGTQLYKEHMQYKDIEVNVFDEKKVGPRYTSARIYVKSPTTSITETGRIRKPKKR